MSSDWYEELQMIAIPDMAQQKVAMTEDKIAINQVKDLYFKSTEVTSRQILQMDLFTIEREWFITLKEKNHQAVVQIGFN